MRALKTGAMLAVSMAMSFAPAMAQESGVATGLTQSSRGMLRGLDKINGTASDISLAVGQTANYGSITVRLDECRYPANDPSSNAFAHLTIRDVPSDTEVFSGWMIAASPALSALDHQRYDVWVIRCSN
ncbi:DUF2155 domain-containing protein [Rhodobacteraceae bacterium]|nr:DUF2155 domain-containing protein [Paracoccaceae bacterium]